MIHNVHVKGNPYPVSFATEELPYLSEEGMIHFKAGDTAITFVKENVLYFSTEGIPQDETVEGSE